MSKKMYDVVVKAGTRRDGKAIWQSVGVMMEGERGPYIIMNRTFNPAGVPVRDLGDSSVILSLFEPKEESRSFSNSKSDDFSGDDIPF